MSVTQDQFTGALLSPEAPVPEGLINPDGTPAAKRFDVYRNNVAVSLTEALETAFPVIAKLLGPSNFRNLAGVYLRRHPPRTPLMMHYGADMPGFLESFAPVATLGYLPDVARLEIAFRASYHAADASPLDPERLQAPTPDELVAARLILAPAVRLIRSDWPVHAIWTYNTSADAPKPSMHPEDVLITRPDFDPEPYLLPPGGGAFVAALAKGRTLGEAADAGSATDGFELPGCLGLLLSTQALTDLDL